MLQSLLYTEHSVKLFHEYLGFFWGGGQKVFQPPLKKFWVHPCIRSIIYHYMLLYNTVLC